MNSTCQSLGHDWQKIGSGAQQCARCRALLTVHPGPMPLTESSDDSLLLRAIIAGVARWEAFKESPTHGEVCIDGLRWSARLSERRGTPILTPAIRHALQGALSYRRQP